ncbi:unnamed protein product [Calypogeia fissa]
MGEEEMERDKQRAGLQRWWANKLMNEEVRAQRKKQADNCRGMASSGEGMLGGGVRARASRLCAEVVVGRLAGDGARGRAARQEGLEGFLVIGDRGMRKLDCREMGDGILS